MSSQGSVVGTIKKLGKENKYLLTSFVDNTRLGRPDNTLENKAIS